MSFNPTIERATYVPTEPPVIIARASVADSREAKLARHKEAAKSVYVPTKQNTPSSSRAIHVRAQVITDTLVREYNAFQGVHGPGITLASIIESGGIPSKL